MGKRWNPGHYFYAFNATTRDGRLYTTSWDKIKNNSNFKGVQIAVWWSTHETSKNTYDFDDLVTDLATINAQGKKCIIRLMDRSFHGYDRGNPLPSYIDSEYDGEWATDQYGEDLVAPKMWLPEVTERWCLFIEACIAATKDAGSGCVEAYFTEECSYSGAYQLGSAIGYTIAGQNAALLKIAQRGAAAVGSNGPQFWMNMGWSNEDINDFTEHYRMTDEIVRTRRCGIGPTDLQSDSNESAYTEGNSYGQYIYDRYAGEAVFPICHEYSSYMAAPTPGTLIDYAYSLGIHYVMWEDMDYASGYGGRTVTDAINAVNSSSGKINSTKPATMVYYDGSRIVADLAALTGTGSTGLEMVNALLYDAQHAPDFTTRKNGVDLPAYTGGHQVTSFKSIQDYNANWRTNVYDRVGGNGATDSLYWDSSVHGHPIFVNSVQSLVLWLWMFAGPGHNSSNTVIEARNMFAQAWRGSTNQWEFFFQGARPGAEGGGDYGYYDQDAPLPVCGIRDGITSWYRPDNGGNVEVWPYDTVPSRGIDAFLGGRNRDLMADAVCFCWGVQVRLALLDPAGVNDIANSVFVACCGADFHTGGGYNTRYDYWGWPLTAMDGGHDRYKRISSTDWVWIGGITIGRSSPGLTYSATEHFEDPGTAPPHGRWSPPNPRNDAPTYSKTPAEIRANPPKLPSYFTGNASGSQSAWVPQDYWLNPSLGGLDIHWSQQGADRAALCIYTALVEAGWLSGFTDEVPVEQGVLPGAAAVGKWFSRYTTEATDPDTADWESSGQAANFKPAWASNYTLPDAPVNTAYTATLIASGTPTPTYSHVSGKPSWMSVASDGDITGTPNESVNTDYTIVFRASNSEGDTDVTVLFRVTVAPVIATTTLPSAPAGTVYQQLLLASGAGPFTWSVTSGATSLSDRGLSLSSNGWVTGTLTQGALSFTARCTDVNGNYDEQAYSVTFGASNSAPAITTTSLASGTVGIAYTGGPVAVSGSGTITRTKTSGALPPGVTMSNSGVLSGTPTQPGTFVFGVTPSSEYGTGTEAILSITVFSAAAAPVANPFARLLGGA